MRKFDTVDDLLTVYLGLFIPRKTWSVQAYKRSTVTISKTLLSTQTSNCSITPNRTVQACKFKIVLGLWKPSKTSHKTQQFYPEHIQKHAVKIGDSSSFAAATTFGIVLLLPPNFLHSTSYLSLHQTSGRVMRWLKPQTSPR